MPGGGVQVTTSTLVIPPAIWRTPRCPVCGGALTVEAQPELSETPHHDVWGCLPCGLVWPDGPEVDGRHTGPEDQLCEQMLRPYDIGWSKQPAYKDAVYQCIRPAGHESREYPGDLCAGMLIVGGNGIPRSRTWRATAVTG